MELEGHTRNPVILNGWEMTLQAKLPELASKYVDWTGWKPLDRVKTQGWVRGTS